jgi:hypothetical protein
MTPLEARSLFQKRLACNKWITFIGIFGMVLTILALYFLSHLPGILTIGLAFMLICISSVAVLFFYRIFVYGKELKLFCNHCGKFIDWIDPWVCGFCDTPNYRTKLNSFLHKCKCCGEPPHSLTCPHCEKLICLDDLGKNENPARMADAKPPPKISPDDSHAREVKEIERKREITRLNAELTKEEIILEQVRRTAKPDPAKPLGVKLEESFSAFRDRNMAIETIAKRELAKADVEYGNDPDARERYRLTVEAWREDNIQ